MKTNPELQIVTFDFKNQPVAFNGDAYVNLTQLCAVFQEKPHNFLRLESTQRLLVGLAADTGLGLEESRPGFNCEDSAQLKSLLITKTGRYGGGTWAHPDVALECARWLSVEFAIWTNRVIRRLMSGQVIHPAMDHESIAKIEAENRAKMRQVVASRYQLYGKWDVAGNVSVLAYSLTAKLPTDRATACRVGLLAKRHCLGQNRAAGLCRQSTVNTSKRSLVATYPPESIQTAFVHLGYDHEAPSLESIEAVWRPMLPFYHRLKAVPLGLPAGG